MKHYSILALILLGALSLGCTKIPELVGDDETAAVIPGLTGDLGDPVTLTTTVSLGGKPESKALTAAGVKTFAVGDCVAVIYKNGSDETVKAVSSALEAGDIHDEGKTAIITVTLTNPAMNGALRYIYPVAMAKATIATDATMDDAGTVDFTRLDSQNGTLASLAAGLDLAVYDGSLTASAGLPATATLTNKLTIGEFNIKNNDGSQDITDSIVHLTVTSGTDEYRIHRLAEAGPIYVAMRPVDNANLTFGATDASNGYEKSVTGKTLAAGSMYPIDLKMSKSFDSKATPLTFEAITAGAEVSFKLPSNTETGTVQYRLNDGAWNPYTSETHITLANVGDKVQFRGKNSTYYVDGYGYGQFSATADCYLYGNIMSLVSDYMTDGNAFASNVTLTGEQTFYRLFRNNTRIRSHASKPLMLPATTLTGYCYQEMFYGCTGLTTAPVLPATTLASYCYNYMFEGCTGLTTAPALPATILAGSCYGHMFSGCTGLTTAPALPATTLAFHCYDSMFYHCSNLNSVTCYALSVPNNSIYSWLSFTSVSGTLLLHPALNPVSVRNNYAVPNGWTVESYVVATKALAMASWEDVGRVIGADGNVYSTIALAEAAGTTARAMIAYLGAVDGVCEHGLAVSLTNVSDSEIWDGTAGAVSTWASSHAVPGCSWRLPSFKDWQYLLIGSYTDNPGSVNQSFINVLLSGVGVVPMDHDYWSSTSLDENTARYTEIYSYGDCYLTNYCSKDHSRAVRACLSF